MATTTATNNPLLTDLSKWYLEMLRSTSAFAEKAVSPPWSANTNRLQNLLLTTSVVLALLLAGLKPIGAGVLGQLAELANKAPLHIVGTILLIYALLGYILASSNDLVVHKILVAEPLERHRAGLREFQESIKVAQKKVNEQTERTRELFDQLAAEQRDRDIYYKGLMDKCEPVDEEWLALFERSARETDNRAARREAALVGGDAQIAFSQMASAKITDLETILGNIFERVRWSRRWNYQVELWSPIVIGLFVLAWSLLAFFGK